MSNFNNKHILSLDYGTKEFGLATYNVGIDPYPLLYERIIVKTIDQVIFDIISIINNETITLIVLGIPYLTDGKSTNKTKEVLLFKKKLEAKISIPIYEQDETLTTVEAKERMKNSPRFNFKVDMKLIDCVSASIILEDFLDLMRIQKEDSL